MKIPGYCTVCRKLKLVRVTALFGTTITPAGICDSCAENDKH